MVITPKQLLPYWEEEADDDIGMVKHYIAEAASTKGLEFFGITVRRYNLHLSRKIKEEDFETVCYYLDHVDGGEPYRNKTVESYDMYTEPYRGADDGTFDYAGSYMITILGAILAVQEDLGLN
jgi:hypothetical protein